MKSRRWLDGLVVAGIFSPLLFAQGPEISLPRPGAVVVTQIAGQVTVASGEQGRPIKVDDRLRVGSIVTTARKSFLVLTFSNGAVTELGPESELEVEEFSQSPISGNVKFAELTAEPTLSKTRLRLVRGDVTIFVKPLKIARGSSFLISIPAGTVRVGDGTVRAMIRMSDVGLGVCTLELQKGAAEYEPPNGAFTPMPLGRKLAFALEVDKASGEIKVGEMPKEIPPKK
ncbi:MAG: hypothetical protein ABIQ12_05605 [Opitutaceae bacterium]